MTSPTSSLRQRAGKAQAKTNGKVDQAEQYLNDVVKSTQVAVKSEWEYKVAIGIITLLAFITRFSGISHPNEVVFDEVHFGKVRDYRLYHDCH